MFKINADKSIEITRGDRATIKLTNKKSVFNVGDIIKFSIVEKKNYNNLIFQKQYEVEESGDTFNITLTSEDTTIGDIISDKKEYWYEIEYNGNQTPIGFDDNKAKKFILYPEAPNKEEE